MRAKRAEREQAVRLRLQGLSYAQILARIPVSRSSLSLWLRDVPLTPAQQAQLAAVKLSGARRGGLVRRLERKARAARIMAEASREAILRLNGRDLLWVLGTTLYWAEGDKARHSGKRQVAFTNTDPSMIRIFVAYLARCCGVAADDLVFALYIHPTGRIQAASRFWRRTLGIEHSRLRVYLKRPNDRPRRKNTAATYYGTMRVGVRRSTALFYRIEGWRRALIGYCGVG